MRAELGGLHDPDLLPHTVATCLGLPGQEVGSQADAIVDYLRGRQLLLILDSCEHLIGACAKLAEPVLRHAAQVTILATSRQPMNVPGEHCCPVPPLPIPEPEVSRGSRGNRDIARQLGISKRTVDAHLEHIFGKLDISSRVQLATGLSPTAPSPVRPTPPPGPPGP